MRRLMRVATPLLLLAALAILPACDLFGGESTSLYDPDRQSAGDPVLSEIVAGAVTLAGIDEITLRGQNFSTEPGQTIVYFENGAGVVLRGTILSITPTEIRVLTPNFPSDDLSVRVGVLGAENFSAASPIALRPATVQVDGFEVNESDEVLGLTRDADGNAVAAIRRNAIPIGIFQFSPGGGDAVRAAESARIWSGIVYNGAGTLLGVRNIRVVFSIPPTGNEAPFAVVPPGESPPAFRSLAAGADGEVWAAGPDPLAGQTRIYRIAADGSYVAHPLTVGGAPIDEVPRALAVFDGALYVASETETTSQVRRYPIAGDGSLGDGETVFNAPTLSDGSPTAITAIAFAADGTMFAGTRDRTDPITAADPIYEVTPAGASAVLYPGVLRGPVTGFAWGPGSTLYYSTDVGPPPTSGADPAPANFFQLETRRTGAPNA